MFADQGVIKWQRDPGLPVSKNYWTTNDSSDFEYLFNKATHYYYTYTRVRKQLMEGKMKADDLIDVLNVEYHINE